MIESSFLCSSAWDSDLFQDCSHELPSVSEFEDCINSFDRESSKVSSCSTTPNDLSCCSSDYEGLTFDECLNHYLPVADSFISEILEDSEPGLDEADWTSFFDVNENCKVNDEDAAQFTCSVSGSNSPKKLKKSQEYQSSKLWSKMSPEEQLKTLHVLSEIVTCHMGIREQIEVIKIIDPTVTISPDDTEFALDGSSLNDKKMKRLQDFVQKHGFCLINSKKFKSSSKNSFLSEKPRSSKILSRKVSSRTKRRQKKQKMCTDEDVCQKRKLELHGWKEAQSGLFVYEKVIKKESNPSEEDEDVNILE